MTLGNPALDFLLVICALALMNWAAPLQIRAVAVDTLFKSEEHVFRARFRKTLPIRCGAAILLAILFSLICSLLIDEEIQASVFVGSVVIFGCLMIFHMWRAEIEARKVKI